MTSLESIKEYLTRCRGIIYDTNTFLWARLDHPEQIKNDIGGGNLLMGIGLFAVLNYLGKVYMLLRHDAGTKPGEVAELNEFLKANPQFEGVVEPKRPGQINETKAFMELAHDAPHSFGISEDQFVMVWRALRNKLTHTLTPGQRKTVWTFVVKDALYANMKPALMSRNDPVFTVENGHLNCFVDLLSRDVERILDWLVERIDTGKFTIERLNATYEWMEENERG